MIYTPLIESLTSPPLFYYYHKRNQLNYSLLIMKCFPNIESVELICP
jgi:hypothetical protein